MAFYDDMKKAIYKTRDNVSQKTENYTEMSKLNASISEQEREIRSLYGKIGEIFYQRYTRNPEMADSDMQPLCQEISERMKAKEAAYEKRLHLKGLRLCEKCGKEIPADAVFCNYCGEKQAPLKENEAEGKRTCPRCGAPYEEHQQFCINCGLELESVRQPEKKVCSNCGCELSEGAAFCMNCGQPVSQETGDRNQ